MSAHANSVARARATLDRLNRQDREREPELTLDQWISEMPESPREIHRWLERMPTQNDSDDMREGPTKMPQLTLTSDELRRSLADFREQIREDIRMLATHIIAELLGEATGEIQKDIKRLHDLFETKVA